jgi:hypothetical protein
MWSTGFRTTGRKASDLPPTRSSRWSTWNEHESLKLSEVEYFTHIKPKKVKNVEPPLNYEEKTGQAWVASNYGRTCPRGWDTFVSIEKPYTMNDDPHMLHHNQLHRISLRQQKNQRHQRHNKKHKRPTLKIHRYPWNAEPLVVGGVDCSKPKTFHLSKSMSKWKRRSEKQLKINKAAGKQRPFSAATGSNKITDNESSRSHIQLDPGKYRRKREAAINANHNTTLLGSFSRMQQYKSNTSMLSEARKIEKEKSAAAITLPRNSTTISPSKHVKSMPRSLRHGSIMGKENVNANQKIKAQTNPSKNENNLLPSPIKENVDLQAKSLQLRNQLIEVIVGESLYRLTDLRALFHETIRCAMGVSDDPIVVAMEKEAAQQAVVFVCNELDIKAVGRLAWENPEFLNPESQQIDLEVHSSVKKKQNHFFRSPPRKVEHWSDS